jgi:hypothetical protein
MPVKIIMESKIKKYLIGRFSNIMQEEVQHFSYTGILPHAVCGELSFIFNVYLKGF